jgi:hypothetical protein
MIAEESQEDTNTDVTFGQLARLLKKKRVRGSGNAARRMEVEAGEPEAEAEEAEGNQTLEELEAVLRSFDEDEIQEAEFAEVSLSGSVQLLLHNTAVSESVDENSVVRKMIVILTNQSHHWVDWRFTCKCSMESRKKIRPI